MPTIDAAPGQSRFSSGSLTGNPPPRARSGLRRIHAIVAALRKGAPTFLVSIGLGLYAASVIAAAPFEPPDFVPPPNLLVRVTAFFEPKLATDPPLPTLARTPVRRGALSIGELEGFGGGVSTQALNTTLPTAVGRIAGSYAVSETGNATYTIPIWTPPGARGIEPHLALVYASNAPDSLLGPGWSLSGLSGITRCTLTWAQDGTPGPVTLTMTDKFCLDGNRLRSTGGIYGADNSTYQTELETFSKVIAHGVAGNGPQWFEVKGKDGLTYEYGLTSDSRVLATGSTTPYLWALNKVRDRQGNNLVVHYTQANGSFRPNGIQYTQTPATGTDYRYLVGFAYINRATGTSLNSYVGGSKVQQQMLLSTVTVDSISEGVRVRRYNLDYTTAPATQRGRLYAVQECTETSCLSPTTITYQNGQAGIAISATSAGTGATSGRVNAVDFDGDGRMDLVYATVSGSSYTSTPGG